MNPDILEKSRELSQRSLFDLLFDAHQVHRKSFDPSDIQRCTLLSIKTGRCSEDCAYCPQSAHYQTDVKREPLLAVEKVREAVRNAKKSGVQRFCMGAAWREVKDGPAFDAILDMIREIKSQGLEACVTLGMLNSSQAQRLKEAGLDAYNHNLDTSREFYPQIIHTRTYDDRLKTLEIVRKAGITVCSGGIIGMGESLEDRFRLLAELASLNPQPESVPINLLIAVKGTPLENAEPVEAVDLVRMIAMARILMPKARVRLSAGRLSLSKEAQLLCFFAGANSIFLGEKLLTQPNPVPDEDEKLLKGLAAGL